MSPTKDCRTYDLKISCDRQTCLPGTGADQTTHRYTYLKLSIGPSWNLNNHVENGLLLIGIQRNVVERGDDLGDSLTIHIRVLVDVDLVALGVGSAILVDAISDSGIHFGRGRRS